MNKIISKCRGCFIISVLIAHCPIKSSYKLLNNIWSILGTIGVVGFFILSDFLFAYNKDSFNELIKKKIKNLVIPWFICSTVIFVITSILGENSNEMNFIDYIKFIFGYGSLYYFITVLISMFIVFYVIKKSNILLSVLLIITPINIMLSYLNIISIDNKYLDVLNWISFFTIGYILNKKNLHKYVIQLIKNNLLKLNILFFISVTFSVIFNQYEYFTPINIITELIGVFAVISICLKNLKLSNILQNIGRKSYDIYLFHMPIAGGINILCNKFNILLIQFLKPLIIIYNCINLYCILIKKIFNKNYEHIFIRIIGIKKMIINA